VLSLLDVAVIRVTHEQLLGLDLSCALNVVFDEDLWAFGGVEAFDGQGDLGCRGLVEAHDEDGLRGGGVLGGLAAGI